MQYDIIQVVWVFGEDSIRPHPRQSVIPLSVVIKTGQTNRLAGTVPVHDRTHESAAGSGLNIPIRIRIIHHVYVCQLTLK